MALPIVGDAAYPTPVEVRNTLLSAIRYSYARAGLTANVKPGSDHYIRMDAIAKRISIALANNKIALANFSPLTATGDDLVALAGMFGVIARPAAASSGFLTIGATGSVSIPSGWQATSPSGVHLETTTANGPIVDGAAVAVIAAEAGASTNLTAGTVVTWDNAGVGGLAVTATVAAGGITGGANADDDEALRARLLRRLAFPGVGGNWSQVIEFAEDSTSSVARAFVCPAVRGPSSYDVVVIGADGAALSSTTLAEVKLYIESQMPGSADLNVTSVTLEEVDIVVNLTLPLPTTAGGAGGGWRDTTPWPTSTNAADGRPVRVTSTGVNTITVNSQAADPPSAGVRFGVWDPVADVMREYTASSVAGGAGAYVITVDSLVSSAVNNDIDEQYVSTGAHDLVTYAAELLAEVAALGPGEKTDSIDILPRGRRQPTPDVESPYSLTSVPLGAVANEHAEILDITYGARLAAGTGTTLTTPTVPATTADPPNMFSINSLAFRKA